MSAEMGQDVKNSNKTLPWTHFETRASYADPKAQRLVASLAFSFSHSQTKKIRKSLFGIRKFEKFRFSIIIWT